MPNTTAADRDLNRLELLLMGHPSCISIVTPEEDHALELVTFALARTGDPLWIWSASRGVYAGVFEKSRPVADTEHAAAALYYFMHKLDGKAVCVMLDLNEHLKDAKTLRMLRDTIRQFRNTDSTLILIDHTDTLPSVIATDAVSLELSLPDGKELEQIVRRTLNSANRKSRIDVRINRRDLQTVVRNLRGLTRKQAEQLILDAVAEDRTFDADDINHILANKRQRLQRSGILEYVEAPVDLSCIGGLTNLKQWLERRKNAMSHDAAEFGLIPPRGVLLLGVQGAGKSLSAKAIATAWQRPLLRLDPGGLYDKFIGESERRLREALKQAEMMSPIILWIDEIEKGFASAATHSNDGGLSQRMFGSLLTWMQEHEAPVFLVATANNIDALPPELLRKGRFDEIFFVDLPGEETRKQIMSIHLTKRKRDPAKFDLDELARESEGYSGAEIEQAIIAALHAAFATKKQLTTAKIVKALRDSPPLSVTMAERINALRNWARSRCVPAE
ncbi:MAG TPA: AAA family ATPase [Phycisphaerales bacterium]|nr:AAA family ATPase [Phycisphaerales bacterium]HRQ76809.1 AAA family ATPase [Phycisphaerales bacterium]